MSHLCGGQPIVILGGFLSYGALYEDLSCILENISGQATSVVQTQTTDWLGAALPRGWVPLLDRLHKAVLVAIETSSTGRVTLVAHSAGGILARIYLSPEPFYGSLYSGLNTVSHLITLGTPHYSGGKLIYGGVMSRWANQRYPGAFYADRVSYVAVAGKGIQGNRSGNRSERRAYRCYRSMTGDGRDWGDGLVSMKSALLKGAHPIALEGVGHYKGFGSAWYGDRNVVLNWWAKAMSGSRSPTMSE